MDLQYHLPNVWQSFGVGSSRSASQYSQSQSRRCQPFKASVHQLVPLCGLSMASYRRANLCRPCEPLGLNRNLPRMFRCKNANGTPPKLLTDHKTDGGEDDDDDDYPLWMEEDDPTWPEDDPNGEGVGFQTSNFFDHPKIMNVPNEDGSDDDEQLDMDWEAEQFQWIVREITASDWDLVALQDPTPLIFFAFERYGPSGPDCWKLLEELEKVLRTIVGSRKYPIRAVKLDISSEPDVGAALKIKTLPSLLFINGGKLLYRLTGVKTEQELLAITSHLFYHSARPDCMEEAKTSYTVTSVTSSK